MTGYIASIEGKPSHSRTKDAWKAMKAFWENVDPATIDETMCRNYRATRRVGDATARLELMKVSTALNWAMKAPHRHITVRGEVWLPPKPERKTRSEEHTSELQSLMRISYAVFCLKKKK